MYVFSFDIESEIAHFRDPFTHSFFNTFVAPPPHTILGLLGNCLGYNEVDTERLGENIILGCIVIKLKGYLKDLAIIENQKNNQRTKTPRTRKFLVNPLYRIFTFSKDFMRLEKIQYSIYHPKRVPYLGISDCLACISNISNILEAKRIQTNEIESLINLDKLNENKKVNTKFNTKIKDPLLLTVYPFIASCPTKYILNNNGRSPINFHRILMSVNCIIEFKHPLDVYQINGDKVFPL